MLVMMNMVPRGQTYQPETERSSFNEALRHHVFNDGWVGFIPSNTSGKTQAHDTSGAGRLDGETKLLLLDAFAVNGDSIIEVVAEDTPCVQVSDIKGILVDKFVCATLVRVNYRYVSPVDCCLHYKGVTYK